MVLRLASPYRTIMKRIATPAPYPDTFTVTESDESEYEYEYDESQTEVGDYPSWIVAISIIPSQPPN